MTALTGLEFEPAWQEGGNRTRAARRLGMTRSTLWMKLKVYGLTDGRS